jgi:beta-phosphoglucomutase-like phosphatase (HAD superfamily)
MADEKHASLIVELIDKASSGLKKLRASWLAITAAVATVTAFVWKAITAWGEQERVIAKLNTALNLNASNTDGASTRLQELAGSLQKVTKFTDDSIINMMALLASYGLNENAIAKLTPKILDLATVTGGDLQNAAMQLGKVLSTNTIGNLTRLGLKVDEVKFKEDAFGAVMDALTKQFDGQAEAAGKTLPGKLSILNHSYDELMESIGKLLSGPGKTLIDWLTKLFNHLGDIIDKINLWVSVFKLGFVVLMDEIKIVIGFIGDSFTSLKDFLYSIFSEIGSVIGELSLAIKDIMTLNFDEAKQHVVDGFTAMAGESKTALDKMLADLETHKNNMQAKIKALFDFEVTQKKKKNADILKDKMIFDKTLSEQDIKNKKEIEERMSKHLKLLDDMRKQREADQVNTLNFISSLSQSKSKELAAIGKAAGVSTAMVDTYVAANKALAAFPPPFNFGMAAAVVTAGLANVARIVGVELAEGGIVPARAGGIHTIIGEGGSAEAVIPLDDDRAKDAIGGDTLIVNNYIGTLVADDMALEELAEKIGDKLYLLKRSGRIVTI